MTGAIASQPNCAPAKAAARSPMRARRTGSSTSVRIAAAMAGAVCSTQRDTALELQVPAAVGADLRVESELSRWFPVWGAPGL